MRRLLSIAFLLMFLFNIGGYYLVFTTLRIRASQEMTARLSKGYLPEETHVFKVPLTLPYPITHQTHKPTHGEFEHNGEFYRIIEQKLVSDTLVVVTTKDHRQKAINGAMKEFSKWAHDVPQSEQSATMNLVSKLFKDYTSSSLHITENCSRWSFEIQHADTFMPVLIRPLTIESPPPKHILG